MSTASEGPILVSDTKLWDLPSPRVMPPFFPLPETKIPCWSSLRSYILWAKFKTSLFLVTATSAVWVDKIRLWVHRSIKAERHGDRAWRCVNLSQMCNLLPEALPPPSTPNQIRILSPDLAHLPSSFWILCVWGGCQAVRHVSSLGWELQGPPQPPWRADSPGRQARVPGFSSRSVWVSAVLPSIMAHGWAAGHPSCLPESPGTESLGPCSLFV